MLPDFTKRAIAIIGGGSSLRGFDFTALPAGSIAINRALEFVPQAECLWWNDAQFWRDNRAAIMAHRARFKLALWEQYAGGELPDPIIRIAASGVDGFDPTPGYVRHGRNSGYSAVHFAASAGARLIVLFGFDMAGDHFHSGYDIRPPADRFDSIWLPEFPGLARALAARGVQVLNASLESALKVWPRCSPEDGLEVLNCARSIDSL